MSIKLSAGGCKEFSFHPSHERSLAFYVVGGVVDDTQDLYLILVFPIDISLLYVYYC